MDNIGLITYFKTSRTIKVPNILTESKFLSLAVSKNDDPWCAKVFYWSDIKNNDIYFVSHIDSKHVQYILSNNQVSLEISDNKLLQGIQASGKAEIVSNVYKLYYAIELGAQKMSLQLTQDDIKKKAEEYKQLGRVVMRIQIDDIYFNVWNGKVDSRVKCTINNLVLEEIDRS